MSQDWTPSPAIALVKREVLVLARNPRLFGLMATMATVLAVAALVILSWRRMGPGQMAGFAKGTFQTQFFLLYAAALVVVPTMAAATVVHERKQDCFPLLYTTLIPPGWIMWSKVIALLALYAGLYAGVLPFTGLIYFFAGVEPLSLIQGALVSFSLALGTASIGVLASATAKDHSRALSHTGLGVILMLCVPWAMRVSLTLLGAPEQAWLALIGPGRAYSVVSSGLPDWTPPLAFSAYQLVIACCCLALARRHIVPRERVRPLRVWTEMTQRLPWKRPRPFAPIPDGQNPIAAKDLRSSDFSRGIGPWLLGLLGIGIGGAGQFSGQTLGLDSSGFEFYPLLIIIPSLAASLLVTERDQDMLGSLGMTLLTGKDIVMGKIAGIQRILRPFIWGALVSRAVVYLGFVLVDLRHGPSAMGLNPMPLLHGYAELFLCIYAMPRFALQGAASRSAPLATTFASYGYLILIWVIVGIGSSMTIFPFALNNLEYLIPWVYYAVNFGALLIIARHVPTQTGVAISQQMRSTT
jgi:hypothetical protein